MIFFEDDVFANSIIEVVYFEIHKVFKIELVCPCLFLKLLNKQFPFQKFKVF